MTATDELRERLVSLTRDLMLIPGGAERPDDLERGMDALCNHIDTLEGIEIRRIRHEGVPSLLALPCGIERPRVLLCGHLDVICHPESDAYQARIENGRVVGPGAGDMKGALSILVSTFRETHQRKPGASLGMLITSDEETGGMAGVRHVFEDLGFRCGGVLLPDGGAVDRITIEEKGLLHMRLEATGHEAHAARPWHGRNAIELLAATAQALRARFEAFGPDPEHWHPTCSMTTIQSPNHSTNRIPEHATAGLDVRFPAPHAVDAMSALVRSCLEPGVTAEIMLAAEPVHLSPDPAFLAAMTTVLGAPPSEGRDHGGSDGRFIAAFGIPVMMARPNVGELHALDEWVEIDSMLQLHATYAAYLEQVLP